MTNIRQSHVQTFEAGPGSLWIKTGGQCHEMEGGIQESGLTLLHMKKSTYDSA